MAIEPIQKIREKEKVVSIPPILDKKGGYGWEGTSSSSIAPVGQKEQVYLPSKPVLDPIQRTMHHFVGKIETATERWSLYKEKAIDGEFKKIDQLHRDEALKMEEAYRASKDVSFWGILDDVGNSVTGAVSFFFGFSALSAGSTAVGGALIVSGVLSIGNLAFKHANLWDWTADQIAGNNQELKAQIKTYLPSAVGVMAAALAIYGSYAAWNYTAQTGVNQIASLLKSTTSIATGMSGFMSGMSQYQLKNLTADLDFLHSKAEFSTLDLENYADEVKDFQQRQTQIHTTLGKIVEETEQAIQVIQQPV